MSNPVNFRTNNKIPLFYWSEVKFIFREKENYGDLLSKYLVEKISKKQVNFVHPKKQPWYKVDKTNFLAVGSIIHHASKDSIVWGSGIIDEQQSIANASFKAVRGPETRKYLQKLGYECPEIYGDPAVLLPLFFKPEVKKKYRLGVVPHYHDYDRALELFEGQQGVKVIDLLTMDVEAVTREIMSCEKTISSSLHGMIVSHAYKIPSVWVEFSDKIFGNGIKYADYLQSVHLPVYSPKFISEKLGSAELESFFEEYPAMPKEGKITDLQEQLLKACPFNF